jgi:hypothetical protein
MDWPFVTRPIICRSSQRLDEAPKKMHRSMHQALQCKGHIAACEGTEDGKERERELMDWVQVLVDILGPPRRFCIASIGSIGMAGRVP